MILLIDNYDSFTYNLVQRFGELDPAIQLQVVRNDKISAAEVEDLKPSHIVISPGPCTPREAGVSNEVIQRMAGKVPILGVCLGHQCIGQAFGAEIVRAPAVMHGKTSLVHHEGAGVFEGLPQPFEATRYHSLVVAPESVPDCLEVTARTSDGVVMGLRHRQHAVEGVQFHPESVLTAAGHQLLANFLVRCGDPVSEAGGAGRGRAARAGT